MNDRAILEGVGVGDAGAATAEEACGSEGGSMSDITWVDVVSALAGSVAAILAAIAVIVTVRVARQTHTQTGTIAEAQERRELQAYRAERKTEFREQCKAVIVTAEAIETLANPRVSELLSEENDAALDRASMRQLLARLSADVNLLTAFRPRTADMPTRLEPMVRALHEEAAWLYADALHLAILASGSPDDEDEVDLRNAQEVVDALLNGSSVNLEPRLLPGYRGGSSKEDIAAENESWQAAYDRRERILLTSGIVDGQPWPDSLAAIAARALGWVSLRRFIDLTTDILAAWNDGDVEEFRFND